jgi:transposase-like protein
MKKILATIVTAAVVGAGGLAVASAATPGPPTTAKSSTSASAAAGHPKARLALRKLGFDTAAKTIGLSPADLLKAMKGGHSIADVAAEHHVSDSTVVNAVDAALDQAVQQAETNGRITSAQAAKIEQAVAKRVPKLVEAKPGHLVRRRVVHGAVDVSAKTIGVTPASLLQSMHNGQSVADIASAHGVQAQTVVNALVKAGDTRIDGLVAHHHLSATRAAKLKARLPQLAQRFVNHTRGSGAAQAS